MVSRAVSWGAQCPRCGAWLCSDDPLEPDYWIRCAHACRWWRRLWWWLRGQVDW